MAFANSLFKRQKSRKPSLGTTELDYLTQNTELKDREMLRFHFDSFIEKHPKGCISKREFRDITGKVYPSKDYAKIEKRIFNMYDKNGDGTISFRELMLVMFVMSDGTPEQNLRQIFKVFDTNNDGIILLKEMKKFVRDIHFLFSPTELESISEKDIVGQAFNEMDKDHDGKVTEDEFVAATLAHEKMASMLTLKIVQVFDP